LSDFAVAKVAKTFGVLRGRSNRIEHNLSETLGEFR
jgi:hypothetical protein